MSTPSKEDALAGNTEVLDTIRQAMEQITQQNATFQAQILEQQNEMNNRLALVTTTQATMAQQLAQQLPASSSPATTSALPDRTLASVLASMDNRNNRIFSTSTSSAPLTPIKKEPGTGSEQANEEDGHTEYGGDAPMPKNSTTTANLPQIPRDILEQLPRPITEDDMPRHGRQPGDPTQHPLPINRFNYNPTHDGLTGVIIGDQAPFEHRLTQFDVFSVYSFLRKAERYEAAHTVQLNLVKYITEDILDTISATTESTLDLPPQPMTWTPRQLKIAMMRYFQTFRYTPRVLCEIAARVAEFPRMGPQSENATSARLAINQLAQIPIYCQRMIRFHAFVRDYRLLDLDWPTEHNKDWGHPKRLNEVVANTLRTKAPQAHTQISEELYEHRKLPVTVLLDMLPRIARTKITALHSVDETLERLARTNTKPADLLRQAGVGRSYLRAPPTSNEAKEANFVSDRSKWNPTQQGGRLNNLAEVEDGSEEDIQDTWHDKESALEPDAAAAGTDPEDINHIHATAEAAVDRSKQICHSHLFHPQGCVNAQRGKPCPFSHDASVGVAELTKVLEKLKTSNRN